MDEQYRYKVNQPKNDGVLVLNPNNKPNRTDQPKQTDAPGRENYSRFLFKKKSNSGDDNLLYLDDAEQYKTVPSVKSIIYIAEIEDDFDTDNIDSGDNDDNDEKRDRNEKKNNSKRQRGHDFEKQSSSRISSGGMGVRAGMSGISAITGYLPQEIESYTLNAYDLCVRHKLLSNSSCTEKNVISDSVNKARFEMTNKDEWEAVL